MPRRPRLNIHRGRNWLYHTAYFLLLAIAAAVFFSADWHQLRRWLAVACFILLIAIRVLDPGPRRRTLSALVRSRFRLCPHCRYDLSAAGQRPLAATAPRLISPRSIPPRLRPRTVTCPECGQQLRHQRHPPLLAHRLGLQPLTSVAPANKITPQSELE